MFAKQNLIKDPPFNKMDFISCRNMLIYLQPVLQKKAMEMFSFALLSKGILFLGHSETTNELNTHFEQIDRKYKIYKSKIRTLRISTDRELMNANLANSQKRLQFPAHAEPVKY